MDSLILRGSEDEGAIDLAFGVVGDAGDVVAEEVVGSGAVADAPAGTAEAGRGAVVDEGPCAVVVTHTEELLHEALHGHFGVVLVFLFREEAQTDTLEEGSCEDA